MNSYQKKKGKTNFSRMFIHYREEFIVNKKTYNNQMGKIISFLETLYLLSYKIVSIDNALNIMIFMTINKIRNSTVLVKR